MIKRFDNGIKDNYFIIKLDISKDILSLIIRIILFLYNDKNKKKKIRATEL
jgi:hypothetical protein